MQEDTFYFIAATYDQSILKLYLDGQLFATNALTMPDIVGLGDLYIGAQGIADSNSFYGVLDEVRIYNRALSDAEIAELYEGPQVCEADSNGDGIVNGKDLTEKQRDLLRAALEKYYDWFWHCWLPAMME